jgi:hypothetical protein
MKPFRSGFRMADRHRQRIRLLHDRPDPYYGFPAGLSLASLRAY